MDILGVNQRSDDQLHAIMCETGQWAGMGKMDNCFASPPALEEP
jgi:hypothetical protein